MKKIKVITIDGPSASGKGALSRKIANQIFKFFITHEIELWRSNTILTKEPETIEWIDNFDQSKKIIFWDIGANIGIYSVYAA